MNHHILYASLAGLPEMLPWQRDLPSRGIVVFRAGNIEDALRYCRAYPLLMVMLEIDCADEPTLQAIHDLVEGTHVDSCPTVIGLHQDNLVNGDREALAAAGLSDMVARNDPDRFVLWRLQTLTMLHDLRYFEQTRASVLELVGRTRERLHDLSQPLSAIQGRLQLLAARCPSDDPNLELYRDLVRLIQEVTHQVMEIHQIHRKYS